MKKIKNTDSWTVSYINDGVVLFTKIKQFQEIEDCLENFKINWINFINNKKEIDSINIFNARMEGFKRAINGLKKVEYAVIGGSGTLSSDFPSKSMAEDIEILEDNLFFETPYGQSPWFRLFRVGDKKVLNARRFLLNAAISSDDLTMRPGSIVIKPPNAVKRLS